VEFFVFVHTLLLRGGGAYLAGVCVKCNVVSDALRHEQGSTISFPLYLAAFPGNDQVLRQVFEQHVFLNSICQAWWSLVQI
jgi:hypothetical protein